MRILTSDYNGSTRVIETECRKEWTEVKSVLKEIPLHLKSSGQASIQGTTIFDPVGTNEAIKNRLEARGWKTNVQIPTELRFLGTDVDFVKNATVVEVQFSNYPFLLNNILRAQLFHRRKLKLDSHAIRLLIVITKTHIFPAANSTLYYEQGSRQLTSLTDYSLIDIPVRLVGLSVAINRQVKCIWSKYEERSRTPSVRDSKRCILRRGRTQKSRCRVDLVS